MRKRVFALLLALCLLVGCSKATEETQPEEIPTLPQVQDTVEIDPQNIPMDWNQYQLSFQLTDSLLEQWRNHIFRQQVGWLEVKWIRDLSEEDAISDESLTAYYRKKGEASKAGNYEGTCFSLKNATEKHFYLSDGNYQIHLIGYAQYSDYKQEDYEKQIASLQIDKGDFTQKFSLSKEELQQSLTEIMKNLDMILEYCSRTDFTAYSTENLDVVMIPCRHYHMADEGPWVYVTEDYPFSEVTKEQWGEDFPWNSTADIAEDILEIYYDLSTSDDLKSELLSTDFPAFKDIKGKLYFNTAFGSRMTERNMIETWNMDSIELLEEIDGTVYFRIDRNNDGRKVALLSVRQNADGQWRLGGKNYTLYY